MTDDALEDTLPSGDNNTNSNNDDDVDMTTDKAENVMEQQGHRDEGPPPRLMITKMVRLFACFMLSPLQCYIIHACLIQLDCCAQPLGPREL
jgi:hypothetical protein